MWAERGAIAISIVLAALAGACSDDETASAVGPGAGGFGDGGSAGGATGGGGGGGTSSSSGGAGGTIPDTECVDVPNAAVEVYPSGSGIRLDQFVAVGSRWAASGDEGYVFFDADGTNADAAPAQLAPNWNVLGYEGDTVGVVASTAAAVQYQRLDESGAAVTGPRGLGFQQPVGVTVASSSGNTLAVWAFNTRLYARGIGADGLLAGNAFDLATSAFSTYVWLGSAGRDGQIAVAWSGDATPGSNETFFVLSGLTGTLGEPQAIYESAESHAVVQVAATDSGYVVLVSGEPPTYLPVLLRVDPDGSLVSSTTLAGARFAHGIAAQGNRIAVIAGRESGEPQVRGFDESIAPLGPWMCLGSDYETTLSPRVANDGAGYATLHTTTSGAVMLHRIETLRAP